MAGFGEIGDADVDTIIGDDVVVLGRVDATTTYDEKPHGYQS
jgi:hypothetical protein